jgi:site-specific recombinase XerD
MQAEGYSRGTIDAYRNDLVRGFFVFLNERGISEPESVTTDDIREYSYFLVLHKHNSNFTRKRKLASIKTFFKYLVEIDAIKVNPADTIRSPRLPDRKPAYLTEVECYRLMRAVTGNGKNGCKEQDTAMILLFLHTGIRVSELINLTIEDINLEAAKVIVTRKGGKEQYLHLNSEIVEALSKYLSVRQSQSNRLFSSASGQKLNRSSLYNKIRRYLSEAGIKKSKRGPHILRHTFCTRLHQKGVDPLVLKELAGHRSLNTTMKYVSIENAEQTEAIDKLKFSIF